MRGQAPRSQWRGPRRIHTGFPSPQRGEHILSGVIGLLLATAVTAASPQADLDAARARWAQQNPPHYGYRVRLSCFCPGPTTRPYDIHVRDGEPVRPISYTEDYDTVPELFAFVQESIDQEVASLSVAYADNGVPTRIAVDYEAYVADDELTVTTSRFAVEDASDPPAIAHSIQDGTAALALKEARADFASLKLEQYRYRHRVDRRKPVTRRTVAPLFRIIRRAIARRVARLDVTYGATGFPRRIVVDDTTHRAYKLRKLS